VQHPAVAAAGVKGDLLLLLEYEDPGAGIAPRELAGDAQPDNPGADDKKIGLFQKGLP
jgi:hypothetical protein